MTTTVTTVVAATATVAAVTLSRAIALGAKVAELASEFSIEALFETDLDDIAVG